MKNYICIDGKKHKLNEDLSAQTCKNILKDFIQEEKKLKFRHGDYGSDLADFIYLNGEMHWLGNWDNSCVISRTAESFAPHIAGNLKDDLKRNAEDLGEFELQVNGGGIFRMRIDEYKGAKEIEFYREGHATATIPEAQEIHQKLGQLISTARRKAKDC